VATTLRKPRWDAWESTCIQKAFNQKIQHKVMALALGRSVPSVSKKIKALGLRSSSCLSGRVKGEKISLSNVEKTPRDLTKMMAILKAYAPLKCFQKGHLALKEGCWTPSQPPLDNTENGQVYCGVGYYTPLFSFVKPLEFVPSVEPVSKGNRIHKISGDPDYVPLHYIEQWAVSEGFHKLKGALRHRGLSYWKDGAYFSQAQLLMHLNCLRFEHMLQPIALMEEDAPSP
jgi:hypothetical protein